ncbi:hypothetical protein OU792_09435 [Algoriphagus sp. NF]|jgi:hypothetical protein|uniref:Anti-sigma factor n=1 Tax=Algoriphagus formosus TaxID=2007308 RepID=A0A4R5UZ39_9BACT|nr:MULTISPECIES: hypothetical protein [Algoriphagus]MDE0560205.1 hypothetical protein [Algoriphagus sp. NF]TDK44366.1 hypothetical protein E1898_11900 [Algoriphagus aquimaris]
MTKLFTPNDLVRYIYQEMPEVEQELLMQALRDDQDLMQEYLEMLSTIESLDQIRPLPSEKVVKAIKSRAHSTGLQKV